MLKPKFWDQKNIGFFSIILYPLSLLLLLIISLKKVFTKQHLQNCQQEINDYIQQNQTLKNAGGITIPDFIKQSKLLLTAKLKDNKTILSYSPWLTTTRTPKKAIINPVILVMLIASLNIITDPISIIAGITP